MIRLGALLVAGCLFAACATPAPAPEMPDAPDATLPSSANDTCGAGLFKDLIGKPIDGPGVPGESRVVRHIKPGAPVTMDYSGQRMNIEANDKGLIAKIKCG